MDVKKLALALLASGCVIPGSGSPSGDDDPTTKDVAQWNALVDKLDGQRTQFLDVNVQDLAAAGTRLYWYDNTNLDMKLDSFDALTQTRLAYTFSVGPGDRANFRGSTRLVVTAEPDVDPNVYHLYDATAPEHELDTTTFPKPDGAGWQPYAVTGDAAYVVTTDPGNTVLYKWVPGQVPAQVTTLESAGVNVGEFWEFGVSGTTMIFVESGRVWKLDLATNHATWLMNMTEASGDVDFRDDGVMFQVATGLVFYDYSKDALVDVAALIDANPYQVNTTFASAAQYVEAFARWRTWVLYIGEDGLFVYDLAHDKIEPVLLSPERADLRIDYKYPVVLDDGEAFVTGLTSTDGAVGVDGPTYKVDLKTALQ
jgi:hypothetical protein